MNQSAVVNQQDQGNSQGQGATLANEVHLESGTTHNGTLPSDVTDSPSLSDSNDKPQPQKVDALETINNETPPMTPPKFTSESNQAAVSESFDFASPKVSASPVLPGQQQASPHLSSANSPQVDKGDEESSRDSASTFARRSVYKKKNRTSPKGILKPSPPPPKGFSFRRDILQNINTKLAQQGMNVQVPVPQGSTAQAATSYIGGMFRKIGGIAAGAAANVGGSGMPGVANFLSSDLSQGSGSGFFRSGSDFNVPGSQRQPSFASSQATETNSVSTMSTTKTTSSNASSATVSAAPLKKVQFQVSHMTVIYPIVGSGTPEDEDLTRLKVEKEHREMLRSYKSKKWTPHELETLYRECCRTREEHPLKKMRLVFQDASQANPPALKTMDLSLVPLDRHAVEPIADLLSVDFALTKLVLENCALTDDSLKSILHALLVSGTLTNLSLASNRRIRFNGWRYIAIFMRRARALRYLDLSENSINKASLEHILYAIAKPPQAVTRHGGASTKVSKLETETKKHGDQNAAMEATDDPDYDQEGEPLMPTAPLLRNVSEDDDPPSSAVISLRLENCGLKTASLEMLAQATRFSDIRHLSLRRNRINQLGAFALSTLLKDYPDNVGIESDPPTALSGVASKADQRPQPPSPGVATRNGSYQVRVGRSKATDSNLSPERRLRSYSPSLPEVPVIVSSPGGGITSRRMPPSNIHIPPRSTSYFADNHEVASTVSSPTKMSSSHTLSNDGIAAAVKVGSEPNMPEAEAMAIYQAKRAKHLLSDLPTVGTLLTLDLKSNDLRGGVVYLAQVLKKNRTLRVLNLSDNSIEMPGLIAIAEALKYNSTLETLDMSHNSCSGPGLEGITTLRTAFTLNSNLKRLFLNDTDLSSEGAIALAEFLPEAKSLIHLDLAENFDIDIAGVMALSVSLRMNQSLRCLDLNIPPNNPDFAHLSQEILQSCIRNTEVAQQRATEKGVKQPVAAPIYKSVVARAARENERLKAIQAARAAALTTEGESNKKAAEQLIEAANECRNVLRDLLQGEEKRQREAPEQKVSPPGDFVQDLTNQSKSLTARLAQLAATIEEGSILEQALAVHDELGDVTTRLERFYRYGVGPMIDFRAAETEVDIPAISTDSSLLTTPVIDSALSSPTFSIADSDDSDEASADESASSRPNDVQRTKVANSSAAKEAAKGLRIDTSLLHSADREETEGEDGASGRGKRSPRSPSEDRARGQLSEEGELFRKVKSLGIDAENDSFGKEAEVEGGSETRHSHGLEEGSPNRPSSSSLQSTASGAILKGRKSTSSSMLHPLVDDGPDVSGEELRKDLLEVSVPPKPPRTKSELEAAEEEDDAKAKEQDPRLEGERTIHDDGKDDHQDMIHN